MNWKPPADAIPADTSASSNEWTPPSDAVEAPKKRSATPYENLVAGWTDAEDLIDKGISLPIGGLVSLFNRDRGDRVFREMDERSARRQRERLPEGVEQTFGDKLASMALSLPAQLIGFPLSPMSTGVDAIQAGEDLRTARGMVAVDTLGNVAGTVMGPAGASRLLRAATGAGVNAAQDTAVRNEIARLAQTEEMKQKYAPSVETAALAAIPGAAFGAISARPKPKEKPKTMTDKLDNLEVQRPSRLSRAEGKEQTPVPGAAINDMVRTLGGEPVEPRTPFTNMVDTLQGKEGPFVEPGRKPMPTNQLSLFDGDPSQGTRSPFNAGQGWDKWEFDENGIPIRKDLSVDVQNVGAGGSLPGRMSQQGDLFDAPLGDLPPSKQSLLQGDIDALRSELETSKLRERLAQDQEAEAAGTKAPSEPPRVNEGSTDAVPLSGVSALDSALEKVRQGRSFDLTAEERIALNNQGPPVEIPRTPEAKRLSAEQLAERVRLREEARKAQEAGNKEQQRFEQQQEMIFDDEAPMQRQPEMPRTEPPQPTDAQFDAAARDTMDGEGPPPITPANTNQSFPRMSARRMSGTRYGRKQGGFIDFGAITDLFKRFKVAELLGKAVSGIMPDPSAKSVIELAKTEKGDYAANRYTGAGATLENMKAGGRAVIFAGKQIVQNWGKRTEAGIRQFVFPFEESIRRLSNKERIEMHQLFVAENQRGVRYTPEELAKAGFNDKQLRAHTRMREMFDMTLELQNEARRLRGERPITGEEAYVAHSWQGAFGRRIFDKNGNTVWVLRGDSRALLNAQVRKLLKRFPELKAQDVKGKDGKIRTTAFDNLGDSRFSRSRDSNSVQSAYSTMIDLLGRDNEIVQQIAKFVENEAMQTAGQTLDQQSHFKDKTGVRGYDGDNPFATDRKNAVKFFEAQAAYAKNAIKWAEVQKGMVNLKEILGDAWLQENQPKTIKWLRDYVANDLGFGENKAIRHIENEFGKFTGLSPQGINNVVGKTKFLWITQKLVASPGYIFASGFQLAMTIPFHLDLVNKGYKGNPINSSAAGFLYGNLLASGHYGRMAHMKGFADVAQRSAAIPDYIRGAMEYAENNSVTNRSVYDETGVEPGVVGKIVQGTVSAPDAFTRSMAFMSFVQHLKDSGMFEGKDRWQQMYQLAEDYTNASMVDARQSEKAGIFGKAGIAGNAFNTLQSFTMNYFNQQSYFVREAMRGNPAPLFASMMIQGMLAGAMSLPFINDIDAVWQKIKGWLPNDVYLKVKDWDLKVALLEHFGEAATYGVVSDALDTNMSTRLQSPQLLEGLTMPGSMVADIGKQGMGWFKALTDYDDEFKWTQAMLNSSPPGLKEALAQSPWLRPYTQSQPREDGTTPVFRRSDVGEKETFYLRSQKEQDLARRTGLRSQAEVVASDLSYWNNTRDAELRQRRGSQIDSLYRDLGTEESMEKINESVEMYLALGGDAQGLAEGLMNKYRREYLDPQERRALTAGENLERIKQLQRIQKILDEVRQLVIKTENG